MERFELSQSASQTGAPIKLEPGSPNAFDYRGINMRDTSLQLYGKPIEDLSSSSNDDTEDQLLGTHQDKGAITMGPSKPSRAVEARLDASFRELSVPLRQEAENCTARLQNDGMVTNALAILDKSLPRRQQKSSRRPQNTRHYIMNKRIEDLNYNFIPDYAPPISTLPKGDPHVLQVEWRKKVTVDLSNDPDRHMLHEAEIRLATSLNLSCAKYLCTKRRIFQARFKALQAGRNFKRSDSQKACKINSNKAGKLCGAFDKVGWFDNNWFLGYLAKSEDPLRLASVENGDGASTSSELTEPDIWDVSESEICFTSEGGEDSTDDDTADSSVSFDGKHDVIEGRKDHDLYRVNSLGKQHYGLSFIGGTEAVGEFSLTEQKNSMTLQLEMRPYTRTR